MTLTILVHMTVFHVEFFPHPILLAHLVHGVVTFGTAEYQLKYVSDLPVVEQNVLSIFCT